MKQILTTFIFISLIACTPNNSNNNSNPDSINMKKQYLFVGTYTKKEGHVDGKAEGIYQISYDASLDKIQNNNLNSKSFKTINPSYIAISPDKKFLYSVQELGPNDGDAGLIEAYRIDPITKDLQFINSQSTNSFAPCHISVDATGGVLIVSNYVGGVVSIFPIQKEGGLAPASQIIQYNGKGVTDRQEASHPHSSTISPDNKFVFIADLGTDKISSYQIDLENHKLVATEQEFVKVQDGAGPRHFTFHPNGKFAYVVNELDATVNVFEYNNTDGNLNQLQSLSTLPEGFQEFNLCADIHVHPSGKYVLASNRGHNSIVVFKVNQESGTLEFVETTSTGGDFPRNFAIDPSGKYVWVANQNSDNVVQFEIDLENGNLKKVGEVKILTPVCLKFL